MYACGVVADDCVSEDYELHIRQGPERARVAGVKEKGKMTHGTSMSSIVLMLNILRSETSRPSPNHTAENSRRSGSCSVGLQLLVFVFMLTEL